MDYGKEPVEMSYEERIGRIIEKTDLSDMEPREAMEEVSTILSGDGELTKDVRLLHRGVYSGDRPSLEFKGMLDDRNEGFQLRLSQTKSFRQGKEFDYEPNIEPIKYQPPPDKKDRPPALNPQYL
jgi:hypothetical protein